LPSRTIFQTPRARATGEILPGVLGLLARAICVRVVVAAFDLPGDELVRHRDGPVQQVAQIVAEVDS
jgi:hypothetical protein